MPTGILNMRYRLYPVRSVRVIYVKEALASEIAKNQKMPVHEPEESGTHTRAGIQLGGVGILRPKSFGYPQPHTDDLLRLF